MCKVEIRDHLTHLLKNLYLYASQETTVRTRSGTMDWSIIGKGVCQGYILSACLFNLYAEYIMQNAGLDETQVGSNTTEGNINSLRYAGDATLLAEGEEALKGLLVKEESEKADITQHSRN